MKRLVLIIISALIMTVFIAFNYLLWDRENRININEDNQASIQTLGAQIRSLTDENKQQKAKLLEQEEALKTLQGRLSTSESERSKNRDLVTQREDFIYILKQYVDSKPMETVIAKWADSIDKGQYDAAYDLMSKQAPGLEKAEFTALYKASVKSLKLKAVSPAVEGLPADRKSSLIFKVTLEVKRNNNDTRVPFIEGTIDRYFAMTFDKAKNDWVINEIFQVT